MRASAAPGLARLLLTHEAEQAEGTSDPGEAADRAFEKLRVHLSQRIGQEGFRTLIARALVLATAAFPALRAVRVAADARLVGLRDSQSPEGAIALMDCLLGLLTTFIGEDLTERLLRAVWPTLPPYAEDPQSTLAPAESEEEKT